MLRKSRRKTLEEWCGEEDETQKLPITIRDTPAISPTARFRYLNIVVVVRAGGVSEKEVPPVPKKFEERCASYRVIRLTLLQSNTDKGRPRKPKLTILNDKQQYVTWERRGGKIVHPVPIDNLRRPGPGGRIHGTNIPRPS